MKLNEFQQSAVDEAPKNITVSAAAGSGKTQVLGARVLRRVSGEEPTDISRLLIVTFTKAAAAEMRSRIGASLTAALAAEADPQRRRALERQLSLLGGADICTIDSFCFRLLKQNFFKVPGLSGDFTVGDEAGVRLITAECMRETVEMFSAAAEKRRGGSLIAPYEKKAARFAELYPDEDFAAEVLAGFDLLAMNYGSAKRANDFSADASASRSSDYVNYVYKIKRTLEAVPDPEQWLDDCEADSLPEKPFGETRLCQRAVAEAGEIISDVAEMLENELEYGSLNEKNTAVFASAAEAVRALAEPADYSEAAAAFAAKPLAGLRVQVKDTAKAKGNPHAGEVMAKARKIWDDAAKLFSAQLRDVELFRGESRPVILAVCELTRRLMAAELEKCMEKKKLSFSICVKLALRLLTEKDGSPSETALELRRFYDEIYVDEAQDIDRRQLALFNSISGGRMFMVGDVKQSIYGFRSAEPELFNRRCEGGENSLLITMNLNYRSNKAVIDAVNGVFSRLMNKSTMDVDYNSMHKMLHGESWLPPENPKAEFIAVTEENGSYQSYNFGAEAQAAANKIKQLLADKTPVFDKSTGEIRPMKKKDIIILMRSVKNDGLAMERVLEENNIDCYFDGGESLFSKGEISAVIDVLTLIDNDGRDIPLAGALRSVMFGFTENDLLKIRTVSRSRSFSDIFRVLSTPAHRLHAEYAQRLNNAALLERCVSVGESLRRWRTAADFRPVGEVITLILNETGFYASVGAMKGGRRRRANLDALVAAAEEFEKTAARGLFSFLDYIKKQGPSQSSSAMEAKTLSESMDVVRIMSIHKSKGLEAPVIILMKCAKPFGVRGSSCAADVELGFSADYINEEKGYVHRSPLSRIMELRRRERERCEEIRLLYVAMTRPRERLICTGCFYCQKALESALSFDGSLSKSGALFLADNYAKLLGGSLADERLFTLTRLPVNEIQYPTPWERLESAPAFDESAAENFAALLGFSSEAAVQPFPAKVSVSALKEADAEAAETSLSRGEKPFREPLRAPAFMLGEAKLTPAQLGTAYHTVMERLDFSRPAVEQLAELAEKGIISEAEHKLIKPERIQALLDSSLGSRMRAAGQIFREAPFMMDVPASEVAEAAGAAAPPDETVAVQGIIDCFFVEGDHIVLVDYKTDVYNNPNEIVEKYEKQLYYYAKAINLKFSDKKIQKYLYLFHKGDIIEV